MGQLTVLIKVCLKDIIPFSIYLIIWIIAMTLFYKVLGIDVDSSSYPGLSGSDWTIFLQVFENSIGNIASPEIGR